MSKSLNILFVFRGLVWALDSHPTPKTGEKDCTLCIMYIVELMVCRICAYLNERHNSLE